MCIRTDTTIFHVAYGKSKQQNGQELVPVSVTLHKNGTNRPIVLLTRASVKSTSVSDWNQTCLYRLCIVCWPDLTMAITSTLVQVFLSSFKMQMLKVAIAKTPRLESQRSIESKQKASEWCWRANERFPAGHFNMTCLTNNHTREHSIHTCTAYMIAFWRLFTSSQNHVSFV